MDTGYPYWSVYRNAQKQTESDLLETGCQSDTENIEGNASPEIYCYDSIDTVIDSCWNPPAESPDDSSVTHLQDSDGSYGIMSLALVLSLLSPTVLHMFHPHQLFMTMMMMLHLCFLSSWHSGFLISKCPI